MMPELYRNFLCRHLKESQILTLEMLMWLLQVHKQVKIERLASCLPLPILYESRRRHLQRFLISQNLNVILIWLPLIQQILQTLIPAGSRIIVCLDRTQWQVNNLLMVTVIWQKRALPIYWKFLEKRGNGLNWLISIEFCRDLVNKLMSLTRQKLPCFQRGLRAISLIELAIL